MLTHVGNSAIWTLLRIYNHSWSFRILLHIWREAIIIPISFDKGHTWKPHIAHQRGKLDKSWRLCVCWLGQHRGLVSRYSRHVTREQLNPTGNTSHHHRQQLPETTYWAWIKIKTRHYALSQEPWRNTKLQSHKYEYLPDHHIEDKLQGYTKNRLKSNSFIHEAKKLKTTRCSCPRHARYSPVYGWQPKLIHINSDNLHECTSPCAGNRWWQYQANSDTSHDMWTIPTRSLDQCLHW